MEARFFHLTIVVDGEESLICEMDARLYTFDKANTNFHARLTALRTFAVLLEQSVKKRTLRIIVWAK